MVWTTLIAGLLGMSAPDPGLLAATSATQAGIEAGYASAVTLAARPSGCETEPVAFRSAPTPSREAGAGARAIAGADSGPGGALRAGQGDVRGPQLASDGSAASPRDVLQLIGMSTGTFYGAGGDRILPIPVRSAPACRAAPACAPGASRHAPVFRPGRLGVANGRRAPSAAHAGTILAATTRHAAAGRSSERVAGASDDAIRPALGSTDGSDCDPAQDRTPGAGLAGQGAWPVLRQLTLAGAAHAALHVAAPDARKARLDAPDHGFAAASSPAPGLFSALASGLDQRPPAAL